MENQQRSQVDCPFYGYRCDNNGIENGFRNQCALLSNPTLCYMELEEQRNPNWKGSIYNQEGENPTGEMAKLVIIRETRKLDNEIEEAIDEDISRSSSLDI